jgi:hypothetical protein
MNARIDDMVLWPSPSATGCSQTTIAYKRANILKLLAGQSSGGVTTSASSRMSDPRWYEDPFLSSSIPSSTPSLLCRKGLTILQFPLKSSIASCLGSSMVLRLSRNVGIGQTKPRRQVLADQPFFTYGTHVKILSLCIFFWFCSHFLNRTHFHNCWRLHTHMPKDIACMKRKMEVDYSTGKSTAFNGCGNTLVRLEAKEQDQKPTF